jgi:hypothetical protein
MAKDEKALDRGRVKVRVIEFEMDGSNQTLRDSIRDIVGAIGRAPPIARVALAADAKSIPSAVQEIHTEAGPLEELAADEDADGANPTSRAKRSPPRTPQILELDLKVGGLPLSELCQKLNLESDTDKYTVIAWWLKENLRLAEISADHIHTGYRHMKWNTPTDAGQPLRALKTRTYGYMRSGSKPGTFSLTHVGENHVNDLMNAAGVSA